MPDLPADLVLFALLGLVSGFASGLFGIGGGILRIPIFMALFPLLGIHHSVLMHMAVGTSVALVIPTAAAASWKQYRQGNLQPDTVLIWSAGVAVGVLVGLVLVPYVSTYLFKLLFVVFLLMVAVYMGFLADRPAVNADSPNRYTEFGAGAGAGVGLASVLTGTGGGMFATPVLKFLGVELKRAVAVGSATGLVVGSMGGVGFLWHGLGVAGRPEHAIGFVDPFAVLAMTPTILLSAPLGVRAANALDKALLQRGFAILALLIAAHIGFQLFG